MPTPPRHAPSKPDTSTMPAPPPPPYAPPLRLSLPFPARLVLATTASTLLGFSLSSYVAGHQASLRFLAENAHRLPRSPKGWYFYHKTKNYRILLASATGGVKGGLSVGAWVAMYTCFEDAVDRLRGHVDAGASVVAGLGVGGLFSLWNRLGYGATVRTAKKGLVVGVAYGVAQDLVRWGKGEEGGVVEWAFGRRRRKEEGEGPEGG